MASLAGLSHYASTEACVIISIKTHFSDQVKFKDVSQFYKSMSRLFLVFILNLLHPNKFCEYHPAELLNLIIHWFFLIQNLRLSKFCMDDLEYMFILYWVPCYFHS